MGASFTYETVFYAGLVTLQQKARVLSYRELALPDTLENATLTPQQQEWVAIVEDQVSIVPRVFAAFRDIPRPEDFQASVDSLMNCADKVMTIQNAPNPTEVPQPNRGQNFSLAQTVGDFLSEWTGDAAREFKRDYTDRLPFQLAAQFNMLVLCAKLIEQEQVIWREAAGNVADMINTAIDMLDYLLDNCDKATATVLLTAVAGIATIAAAPVTGPSLAILLGTIDAGASVGATLLKDDPPKPVGFDAATATQVILEVTQCATDLITQIYEQESKIAQVLYQAASHVLSDRTSFVPKSPQLVTGQGLPVNDPGYLGAND
ncbi:hypothetical protein [Actinoplanes subglobosus]|uniref:ESX-1 secretion-associated protein EspA/EspE-like domain-containing protein n=1 Tax=Actinoplanes subglobosus TaxID=1547892 RepID=A0ABV8IM94_9ACTN